jgi:glycosyltransferase involved in cell wall biosynthesis
MKPGVLDSPQGERPMRVLYFSRGYTPHDHRFLAALAATENEIHFLPLFEGQAALEARPLPEGVRRHPSLLRGAGGPAALPSAVSRLKALLRAIEPDLVHAGPIQQSAFLTAVAGFKPLVAMSWGSDLLRGARRGPGRWAASHTLRRSDAFVCDCRTVRSSAIRLGADSEKIVVFPWGVDLDYFSPRARDGLREQLGWGDSFVLLSTRSWERGYGVEIVVKAFLQAARTIPELRLLMLGDGSLRPRIQRMLAEGGAAARAHLPGQVGYRDLPAHYAAADLYVSASRSDGSSVSLLEAMACGRPALVSDIPGNREWVEPGAEGWWFRDGDALDLARGIQEAHRRRGDLPQHGARARKAVEARADWRKNFPLLIHAYRIALGRGTAS